MTDNFGMDSPVEWIGYYLENGVQIPMAIQDMKISSTGVISGLGFNSSGNYTVKGKLKDDGSFNFELLSLNYAPTKSFSGSITASGSLQGLLSSADSPQAHFELMIKGEIWDGEYTDDEGNRFRLIFFMSVNKSIQGLGRDKDGVYVISGNLDINDYHLWFQRNYFGEEIWCFSGNMANNGQTLVINGQWSRGLVSYGKFTVAKAMIV